jgi:hypothetical protein
MKRVIILGLYHQYSLLSLLLNNLEGMGRVKGSLVRGRWMPRSFLIVMRRERIVNIYKKAAEQWKTFALIS